jgi:hypothetical protein
MHEHMQVMKYIDCTLFFMLAYLTQQVSVQLIKNRHPSQGQEQINKYSQKRPHAIFFFFNQTSLHACILITST